jgi:hypothetical protein
MTFENGDEGSTLDNGQHLDTSSTDQSTSGSSDATGSSIEDRGQSTPEPNDIRSNLERAVASQRERAETQERTEIRTDGRDQSGKFITKTAAATKDGQTLQVDPNAQQTDPAAAINPQQQLNIARAPGSLSPATKANWQTLPEYVRQDIIRREQQVSEGFKRYEGLAAFAEAAQRNGGTLRDALEQYTSVEALLEKDFPSGISDLCRRYGVDERALAIDIAKKYNLIQGQAPNLANMPRPQPQQFDPDELIRRVKDETIAEFQQRQSQESALTAIQQFAADPKHLYFQNVAVLMGQLMEGGHAATLEDAYDMACRADRHVAPLYMKAQQDAEAAKRQDEQAALAIKAKQANRATVGSPPAGPRPAAQVPDGLSVRQNIEHAVRLHSGRA